jgi:hypothetical protein
MRQSVIVPVALLAFAHLGCNPPGPQPNDPSQMNQYGGQQGQPGQYGPQQPGQYGPQQPGQYGPQQPGYGQPQPGYGQPQAQPAQPAQPAGGGAATPIAPAAAMAATPVLQAMAASSMQGMKPEGGAFAGQFQEGQTLEQPFNIQPGKCYGVLGVGLGIQELHVQIVGQPAPMLPPVVIAQDNGTGPNPTLGGGGQCWKNPLPVGGPAKVVVKATHGAGIGVAQIFSK